MRSQGAQLRLRGWARPAPWGAPAARPGTRIRNPRRVRRRLALPLREPLSSHLAFSETALHPRPETRDASLLQGWDFNFERAYPVSLRFAAFGRDGFSCARCNKEAKAGVASALGGPRLQPSRLWDPVRRPRAAPQSSSLCWFAPQPAACAEDPQTFTGVCPARAPLLRVFSEPSRGHPIL